MYGDLRTEAASPCFVPLRDSEEPGPAAPHCTVGIWRLDDSVFLAHRLLHVIDIYVQRRACHRFCAGSQATMTSLPPAPRP